MGHWIKTGIYFISLALLFSCCEDNPDITSEELLKITFNPVNYEVLVPEHFPPIPDIEDNPMTVDGVNLGKHLFYDPILSKDSTMSCATCHLQVGSFTDNVPTSPGVEGMNGKRSSMSIINVAYMNRGLFWDGRAETLEDQALLPVEDPLELNAVWEDIEADLRDHQSYPAMFRKAFGISHENQITRDLAVKAISQFERTVISTGNSKFDQVQRGEAFFTDEELSGFEMFFDSAADQPDAECGHCHNVPFFFTNEYFNNGIDSAATLDDFEDKGRGEITGNAIDNGKFRAPGLRNIEFSAPYMHDGRFETLEEVLAHYNSGGHPSPNKDILIRDLNLKNNQVQDIIAFLKTLSDTTLLNDPKFSSPFE